MLIFNLNLTRSDFALASKTRQKERRSKALEIASELGNDANEPSVQDTLTVNDSHSLTEDVTGTVFRDPTNQDNNFEVLSQRVDEKMKTGLKDSLEKFQNRLSGAISDLSEVVSFVDCGQFKGWSDGGSGEEPGCSWDINPAAEISPSETASNINLTVNRDDLTEFEVRFKTCGKNSTSREGRRISQFAL